MVRTDEEILWRSLATFHGDEPFLPERCSRLPGATRRCRHCAAFRDRTLSDFIGFSAARNDPLRRRSLWSAISTGMRAACRTAMVCAVILDGEMPGTFF